MNYQKIQYSVEKVMQVARRSPPFLMIFWFAAALTFFYVTIPVTLLYFYAKRQNEQR